MTKNMQTFLVSTLFAASAFADMSVVTKNSYPGHVHPDFARNETCEVKTDRVIITRTYGRGAKGVTTTETRHSKQT